MQFQDKSLFVGNLDGALTQEALYEIFQQFGATDARIIEGGEIEHPPFAYVNFETHENASQALTGMQGEFIAGRKCRILWGREYRYVRKYEKTSVFIQNFDPNVDESDFLDKYGDTCKIISIKVPMDHTGVYTREAYLQFEGQEWATYFVNKFDGKLLNGEELKVEIYGRQCEHNMTDIYVVNLEKDCTDERLKARLEEYGEVERVVLLKGMDNISKCCAYVKMGDNIGAQMVVDTFNSMENISPSFASSR